MFFFAQAEGGYPYCMTRNGPVAVNCMTCDEQILTLNHGYADLGCAAVMENRSRILDWVELEPGAFVGCDQRIVVPSYHHVYLSDWRAQLLFGADQAFVKVKDIVDGKRVNMRRAPVNLLACLDVPDGAYICIGGVWIGAGCFEPTLNASHTTNSPRVKGEDDEMYTGWLH